MTSMLIKSLCRKAAPLWSAPAEFRCITLAPAYLSRPGVDSSGLGFTKRRTPQSSADFGGNSTRDFDPSKRRIDARGLYGARGRLAKIFMHQKATKIVPAQSNMSMGHATDKTQSKGGLSIASPPPRVLPTAPMRLQVNAERALSCTCLGVRRHSGTEPQ